ncbi:hypothetical protein GGI12_001500, partial [Dipsacomyces acuminosporus]
MKSKDSMSSVVQKHSAADDDLCHTPSEEERNNIIDDSDDPFAYDSDLETLSSVSSHSSISSSSSSILDQALSYNMDVDRPVDSDLEDGNDDDDDDDDEESYGIEQTTAAAAAKANAAGSRDDICDEQASDGLEASASLASIANAARKSNNRAAHENADADGELSEGDDDDEAGYDKGRAPDCVVAVSRKPRRSASSPSTSRKANKRLYSSNSSDEGESEGTDTEEAIRTKRTAAAGSDSQADEAGTPLADAESSSDSTTLLDISKNSSGISADPEEIGSERHIGDNGAAATEEEGCERNEIGDEEEEEEEDAAANEARRSEALIELTSIEIEFAKLRERLYTERLQQVQIEEDHLVSGQHIEYEKHVEEISSAFHEQVEKLQYAHQAWLEQRQKVHDTWMRAVSYTYLVQRQELRSRLIGQQQRRLWRLRDMRVQNDRKYTEMQAKKLNGTSAAIDDLSLITQQAAIQQIMRARKAASLAQSCMSLKRKHGLVVAGIDSEEMDADYIAMQLPVYPREQKSTHR